MSILIETERLILKNYYKSDLENIYNLKSNSLVWRYSTKVASSEITESKIYLESVMKNYEENKYDFQALFLKGTKEYIGEAGILSYNKQNKRAMVGYNLLPEHWSKGYGTEITKALVEFLFETIKAERVEALAMEKNIGSRKVLEKSGFILEGLLRNFAYVSSEYVNVCYYGIIREDYINKTTT